MAAAACVGRGRVGWVEFTEEPSGGDTESQTGSSMDTHPAAQDCGGTCSYGDQTGGTCSYGDQTGGTCSYGDQTGSRHSVCSTASFWSAAPPSDRSWNYTQSEHGSVSQSERSSVSQSDRSSVSMGASTGDLPSLDAEELTNEDTAHPRLTPNSSVFTEDEGGDNMMDAVSWTSSNQSDASRTSGSQSESSRSTWVTFDDDDDNDVRKVSTRSVPRPGRTPAPTHIRLDGQPLLQQQEAKSSNLIGPPPLLPPPAAWKHNKSHGAGAERPLVDLAPQDPGTSALTSGTHGTTSRTHGPSSGGHPGPSSRGPPGPSSGGPPGPSSGGPPAYTKKNPFLDAEFSDIKPSSAINPFSSYFEEPPREDRKWRPAPRQSNGAPQGGGGGPYGATQGGGGPYGATQGGGGPYGATQGGGGPYGATQGGGGAYGATQAGGGPYGTTHGGDSPYGATQGGGGPYGATQGGGGPYGAPQGGGGPYGATQGGGGPYGAPQGGGPGAFGFFESSTDEEPQDAHQHSNGDGTGGTLGGTLGATLGGTLGETLEGTDRTCSALVLDQLRGLRIADPDQPGSPALPGDPWLEEEQGLDDGPEVPENLYQPEHMKPREGWSMLLRIPEKKNIMSSRHWGPIYVRLSNGGDTGDTEDRGDRGEILLFYEQGLDKPFRTLRLDPSHQVSEHRLQSYEEAGRVHSVSVELVQYRERRRGIQPKSPVTRQPIREQLVKLATASYADYLSFRHALTELLRRVAPPPRDWSPPTTPPLGGVASTEEEVQVEVRDEFFGRVSEGDGSVLEQLVVTQVNVLAFLSGLPRCILGLNDVQVRGKEAVSRHDIIPTATPPRWLRLQEVELNEEHASELDFLSSRCVAFTPPPAAAPRRFELLRFRTPFRERTPPFTLRTVAGVAGAEVTVQSWLLMSQGFSTNRDALNLVPCENVAVRYPIPESWAKNFRREGAMGGERSLKARFHKGASFGAAGASGAEPAMRVTMGTAKYEPAFKAVVWRIARLPDKNSALAHPHTFFCRLELGSDQEVPLGGALEQRHLEVEFDMPATTASGATVRSLSVADRQDVKRWITYASHYHYQVPIEQKRDGTTANSLNADQPNECAQQ